MSTDDLAFPCGSGDLRDGGGLSKRELIAAMAMQGALSNPDPAMRMSYEKLSVQSVKQADALLAALATPEAQP